MTSIQPKVQHYLVCISQPHLQKSAITGRQKAHEQINQSTFAAACSANQADTLTSSNLNIYTEAHQAGQVNSKS